MITSDAVPEEERTPVVDRSKLRTYRTLMRRAGVKNRSKHLGHLDDLEASSRLPTGRVSKVIYERLHAATSFDRYNRQVRTLGSKKTGDEQKTRPVHRPKQAHPSYKEDKFGPPGLAAPRRFRPQSEGNEVFHAYEGEWLDGKMHGLGKYEFTDGSSYQGRFCDGLREGEGIAEYANGSSYVGSWKRDHYHGQGTAKFDSSTYVGGFSEGKRHGTGRLEYSSGLTYEGDFRYGKFHGRGTLVSASGFRFEGTFHRGFINGPGSLVFPSGKRDTRRWTNYGGFTLKQVIEKVHQEKAEAAAQRVKDCEQYFGVRFALQLKERVERIKSEIAEARREEMAQEKKNRRAQKSERAAKIRKAREEAMEALANESDARYRRHRFGDDELVPADDSGI